MTSAGNATGKPRPILLLAALHDEMRPTARHLHLIRASHDREGAVFHSSAEQRQEEDRSPTVAARGGVIGNITAVVAGIGSARAVAALRRYAAADRPNLVIHLGFAGGLDPAVRVGTVLRFGGVKNQAGQVIALDRDIPRPLTPDEPLLARPLLLTADQLIASPRQKRALFEQHRAAAVDMETFPVAALAAELSLPFIALRAISDPADRALPEAAADWVHPDDGRSNPAAAIRWLLTHPWGIGTLLRLAGASRACKAALAPEIERIIRERA